MTIDGMDDVILDLLPVNQVQGAKTPVLIDVSRLNKMGTSGFLEDKSVIASGANLPPQMQNAIREVERLREKAKRLIIVL